MQKIELLHFSSVEVDHPNRSIKISLTQQSCKNLKFSPSSLLARVEHKINIVLFNLSARTDSVTRWGGGGGGGGTKVIVFIYCVCSTRILELFENQK